MMACATSKVSMKRQISLSNESKAIIDKLQNVEQLLQKLFKSVGTRGNADLQKQNFEKRKEVGECH